MFHVILCLGAWTLVSVWIWHLLKSSKRAVTRLQRLHQIPCDRCTFFTGDYRLKCTVHPSVAMSEEALGCRDFISSSVYQSYSAYPED